MPSSAQQSEMRPGPELLTIGALSRETGIPVPTLRTWERRYGQPSPLRRPSGHRLYPAEWIERLRKVEFLLQQGHRAANVLVMSLPQLEALVAMSQARQITPRYVPAAHTDEDAERVISRLMRATQRIEREVLMGELRLEWARLGPLRFLSEVAAPFMAEVGDAWRRGDIEVRHEHFAAACMRGLLHELRQPYDHTARGPRVVASALPGDQHDIGLLMAALVLALRGRRVLYLGADLPVEDTVRTAMIQRCEAVAVSVSSAYDAERAATEVARMRDQLPGDIALWVGGAGVPAGSPGVERLSDLYALDQRLEATAR